MTDFRCSLCGLSDRGFERLEAAGFDPHPCRACAEHFDADDDISVPDDDAYLECPALARTHPSGTRAP